MCVKQNMGTNTGQPISTCIYFEMKILRKMCGSIREVESGESSTSYIDLIL